MIAVLVQQLAVVVATLVVFLLPGWAVVRLLQLQLRMPVVAIPAASFAFGLGIWTLLLVPALALGVPILGTLGGYAVVAALLVAWMALRERRRGHAKLGTRAVPAGWTIAVVALATLAAAVLRTRIAFDSLFHVGMVRRIAELGSPTFENLDRVVGAGINPAYAVPAWQAAMASIAAVTGLDAATVVEACAVVGVLLAACSAAALGRAVTDTRAGELAAVAAYAWLRVTFPRRELEGDGVAYASLPGNLALDVMLPLALVAAVLLLRSAPGTRRDGGLVLLGGVASALLVVLHANYVVYLAIIGVGVALWLLAAGPWGRGVARRLALAAATLGVPGLVVLAGLLPLLMLLEHFGASREARIDYHLTSLGGVEFVRPGHLYDAFAVPGLLGMLVLPWAAWIARGATRALIAGGSLALVAFALVPWLVDLLGASGSLTLSLRLPRPLGVLLVATAAVALPDLVGRTAALATRVDGRHGAWGARAVRAAPVVAVLLASVAYGYPLVRREPAQYGWEWPTLVAVAGLLAVLVLSVRARRRAGSVADPARAGVDLDVPMRTMAMALLAVAAAMLPSGAMSMRRAAWQSREVVAAYRADDLRCFDGVQSQLRALPAGEVLLADPVTAYGAQALAPVRVAGDFKTWNGSTDSARIDRRIQLLRATFDSAVAERAGIGLARLSIDLDARWLLVADGEVEPPLGSELEPHDARGLRELLESGSIGATLVARGDGRFASDVEESERTACQLSLWRLDGSERELELVRDVDEGHADDGEHR